MSETKELELFQHSSIIESVEGAGQQRLVAVANEMLACTADTLTVGALALEAVLDLLDFERGVLIVVDADAAPEAFPERLKPLVSRTRRCVGGKTEWSEVRNPAFSINHATVGRALSVGSRLLIVQNSLVQPSGDDEGQHRTAVCLTFDLTDDEKGVVYLDRSLGLGELEESHVLVLREFVGRCLHLVSRAYVLEKLRALRTQASFGGEESEEIAASEVEIREFHGIVGTDEKLGKLFRVIDKVKDNNLNICVVGESGTGKELLARAVHESGKRRDKLFVAENCGAISETLLESELFGHVKGAFTGADDDRKGLFELANGGTLFLDEIGDTSEGMQRKLLRVLQEGVIRPIGSKESIHVDVRVVCASNRDLKSLVDKGTFRADLFYRLNVITLQVPPLRERPGDIPLLVQRFTDEACAEENISRRFSESALKALVQYTWPGNIRELRNVVRRALITSTRRVVARKEVAEFLKSRGPVVHSGENIERDEGQVTIRIPARESFNEMVDECERVILSHALKGCAWNKSKVTKVLKIPRQSLYNKIARYDLQREWNVT